MWAAARGLLLPVHGFHSVIPLSPSYTRMTRITLCAYYFNQMIFLLKICCALRSETHVGALRSETLVWSQRQLQRACPLRSLRSLCERQWQRSCVSIWSPAGSDAVCVAAPQELESFEERTFCAKPVPLNHKKGTPAGCPYTLNIETLLNQGMIRRRSLSWKPLPRVV